MRLPPHIFSCCARQEALITQKAPRVCHMRITGSVLPGSHERWQCSLAHLPLSMRNFADCVVLCWLRHHFQHNLPFPFLTDRAAATPEWRGVPVQAAGPRHHRRGQHLAPVQICASRWVPAGHSSSSLHCTAQGHAGSTRHPPPPPLFFYTCVHPALRISGGPDLEAHILKCSVTRRLLPMPSFTAAIPQSYR